jgi:succinate dehydrogenase/fumarate reductase flavoprotein subunit
MGVELDIADGNSVRDAAVRVVVVGFGAAGASAAITARRMGASVVVLEKQPEDAHTPSIRMSGGLIMSLTDVARGAGYLDACAGGMVPNAVSAAWAQRAAHLPQWLRELAPELELSAIGVGEQSDVHGFDSVAVLQPGAPTGRLDRSSGAGRAVWAAFLAASKRYEIDVRWDSPVRRLCRSESGRIDGIELVSGERIATDSVILACGGYEFDEAMKRDYLRAYPIHFYGNPGNTGDGVRMAMDVGADLWHMNQMIGRAIGHFELADGTDLGFVIDIAPPGYVITDRRGERFADEAPQAELLHGFYYELLHFDHHRGEYPRVPCYWFFDERRRESGPLTHANLGAGAVGLYDWSPDNSREINSGWIHRGNSIEEVAAAAGIESPEKAAQTVRDYNAACASGIDPLGRPLATMIALDRPPYYCVRLWPGGSNTSGGPRRDERARVLDVFGVPIPGLYAAGELGQAVGLRYPADGANLSEAMCFGQIAAEEAVTSQDS